MADVSKSPAARRHGQTPRPGTPSEAAAIASQAAPAPASTSPDDRGLGRALFLIFISAVLTLTCAVAFLALFSSWWVLGLVFGLDLLVTCGVGATVFTVLGDGRLRGERRAPTEPEPGREPPVHPRTQVKRSPIAA
jgi:hypothetical protein